MKSKSFKSIFLTSAAGLALIAGAAAAQAQDSSTPEEVVVTGTRIASGGIAAEAEPLTVVSADMITQSKTVTLEDTLQKIPSINETNASNDQNSISPGGISTADLRGLGNERTLVLIDGQRMVSSFIDANQGQDLNNIPVALIDRIEILRDGASPIYGADAIGGVINIITKKNFSGLQLDAGGGISTYGDHATKQFSALFGMQGDKGGVTAGLQYSTEDPVRQSTRSWASGIYAGSSAIPYGRFQSLTTGQLYCGQANNTILATTAKSCGSFNTGNDPDLIQGRAIINANLEAHYAITDNIQVYSSSFFTNRKASAQLNPEPVGDVYPSAKWLAGVVIPASNPSNPTGTPLALRKRLYESGDRIYTDNADTFQEKVGVKGKVWDDWSFDTGYQFGESDSTDKTVNDVNLTHIQELVGAAPCESGAPVGCGTALLAGPNSLTPAEANYIRYTGVNTSTYEENLGYLDITGTLPWFEMPGGPIGIAFGTDWRRESVKAVPDSLEQTGDFAEGTSAPTQGQYSVAEEYAEANIPVLKDVPFAEHLSFDVAGRLSQYSNFGSANVYKGSFDWGINDMFAFNGSYGTGVRAPQVGGELYLGANQSADGYSDPCVAPTNSTVLANCKTAIGPSYNPATFTQAVPQLSSARTGTSTLLPETSKEWNVGTVITLNDFIPNLVLTANYYHIHLNNQITLIDPGTAVSLCYNSVKFSDPNCANFAPRNAEGSLTLYTEPYTNSGYVHTDGVDMGFKWNTTDYMSYVGLDGWNLGIETQATFVNNYLDQNLDGTVTQYAGSYVEAADSYGYPKWKGFLTATLTIPQGASLQLTERFISRSDVNAIDGETPDEPGYTVPALGFMDLNVNFPWDIYNLNVGIDNVFDKDPPLAIDPYVQTLTNQYDFAGRSFYAKVSAKL